MWNNRHFSSPFKWIRFNGDMAPPTEFKKVKRHEGELNNNDLPIAMILDLNLVLLAIWIPF
jgi:hypothetical protein